MVEVLSDATRDRDLIVKRELCRKNKVRNYLMLDPETKKIQFDSSEGSVELGFSDELLVDLNGEQCCVIRIDFSRLLH